MCQDKIIKLLKKAKKPLTNNQIAEKIHVQQSTASSNLAKLRKYNEVKFVYLPVKVNIYKYNVIRSKEVRHYFL